MSTPKKAKKKKAAPVPTICWFEIPANDMKRAKLFYGKLFGWEISPFRGMADFLHIDTGEGMEGVNGGMMPRKHPGHFITHYISVASVDKSSAKVKKLGGKICMPKMSVPQMGYFAVCQDTEANTFGLWETDEKAK